MLRPAIINYVIASRFSPFAVVGARFDFMHLPGGAVFGFRQSEQVCVKIVGDEKWDVIQRESGSKYFGPLGVDAYYGIISAEANKQACH